MAEEKVVTMEHERPTPILARPAGIDIVIPFYRNAHLVRPLYESFQHISGELATLSCTIVAINDSPDDLELRAALEECHGGIDGVSFKIVEHTMNLGFITAANRGLREAVERGR